MTRRWFGLVALAAAVSGCFTVVGTLTTEGSGKLTVTYFPRPQATVASETKRFSSPHVTVENLRIEPRRAVAELRFDDVTKLNTAAAMADATVSRTREGATEQLKALLRNTFSAQDRALIARHAREHPEAEGPTFELALPGPIVAANRGATKSENRVAWKITLAEYARADVLDLEVTYKVPAGGVSPTKAVEKPAPPAKP
jgi:hypothetical protein